MKLFLKILVIISLITGIGASTSNSSKQNNYQALPAININYTIKKSTGNIINESQKLFNNTIRCVKAKIKYNLTCL